MTNFDLLLSIAPLSKGFEASNKMENKSHRKIFGGNQTIFFGYGIVTIEMFEKKMFEIMCHMMGCNDSSG